MPDKKNIWTQEMDETLLELIRDDLYSAREMTRFFIDQTVEDIIKRGKSYGFEAHPFDNSDEVYFQPRRSKKQKVESEITDKLNGILSLTMEITELLKQHR